jgi:beta-galactosidase GanA
LLSAIKGYLEECRRIVTLLAERYGRNPHVQAWQTDNEYGCHDTILSYSDAARAAFRDWLAQEIPKPAGAEPGMGQCVLVDGLRSFDEIDLPNLTVTEPNPAHVLDFRRFLRIRWWRSTAHKGYPAPPFTTPRSPITTWAGSPNSTITKSGPIWISPVGTATRWAFCPTGWRRDAAHKAAVPAPGRPGFSGVPP